MWTPALLAALALPLVYAQESSIKLLHRFYHPLLAESSFSERGAFVFTGNQVSFQPSSAFTQDLQSFGEALQQIEPSAFDRALYQVALQRDSDTLLDLSSVKLCHLPQTTSETLILHTLDRPNAKPYALDYFVSPIPHDGACPKRQSKKSLEGPSPFEVYAKNVDLGLVNTTVTLRFASLPPLPELRTPPPLSPEGEVVEPVPEKTFIQKYWMYIAAVLVATLLAGGGPEEAPPK